MAGKRPPPPLPPRKKDTASSSQWQDAPPPYDSIANSHNVAAGPWETQDPRSSSTQSLVPSENNEQNERRKLLMVYIHGFMGDVTSFRSFPAHVHHLLTVLLAETHVVHTKLYPRYRSKRNISFARDDFSTWLEPHEDRKTDIVLLGHSMGGLLAAEVVLMPASPPASRPLKHRILGTVNFDVPYLGMHPGVIKSGLASLFNPAEPPKDETLMPEATSPSSHQDSMSPISPSISVRSDTLWSPDHKDPNFDTPYPNDVKLPVRQGWRNAWHFVNKHSGELGKATKSLVASHMEFGGAMANYGELKMRYTRVRALEEEDDAVRRSVVPGGSTPYRARFINYYTASTGKPKKPKIPKEDLPVENASKENSPPSTPDVADEGRIRLTRNFANKGRAPTMESEVQASVGATPTSSTMPGEYASTIASTVATDSDASSFEEQQEHDAPVLMQDLDPEPYEGTSDEADDWNDAAENLTIDDPSHEPSTEDQIITSPTTSKAESLAETESLATSSLARSYSLPPIPEAPAAPPPLDVSYISDPATKKLVEREHTRAVKTYEKAVKDRQKAITDRANLEKKHKRDAEKNAEKEKREAAKAEKKEDLQRAKLAKLEEKKAAGKTLTQAEGEELRLDTERQRVEAEARRMRGEPDPPKREVVDDVQHEAVSPVETDSPSTESIQPMSTRTTTASSKSTSKSKSKAKVEKAPKPPKDKEPPKDRMFCTLPPADSNGERDPCWVRIFMKNVDEVGAHCGLFFIDERYEKLVGDVAERVEGWIKEAASERAARRVLD
ncbi:hypothetical protein LTR97_002911 [Elasticomyces elasticus]|uniref:AB hydrolase-1 domain-containing protein n=1 Tax=Elasticomyces elasticus TaxID=574655 RepID=A0AAN8A3N0_9PEZI|nr:hypothetical protein LTR97_002911 [Elasticomyces elasticus]